MNQKPEERTLRVEAILAAILFNINKTELVKVKPDDASPEVEILSQCVGIEQEEDALVCVIPMEKIAKFACIPYRFQFKVDEGHAIISFEKLDNTSSLVNPAGQQIATESAAIHNLIKRLQLGSERVSDNEQNTK